MASLSTRGARYYDSQRNCIIYAKKAATADYWDDLWLADGTPQERIAKARNTHATKLIQKYLKPSDGIILEGGCGTGIHVAALANNGYRCIGVDFAAHTIEAVKTRFPELDVRLGDVRKLDFENSSFAGYWSGGVIEHFWEGYEQIGREMARVLRSGGYLFLAFPYMSPLRKLKARLKLYPTWASTEIPDGFYQFALDLDQVIQDFSSWGFELVDRQVAKGLRATKEEMGPLNPLLRWLYEHRGDNFFLRALGFALSALLTTFSAHSTQLILQKTEMA